MKLNSLKILLIVVIKNQKKLKIIQKYASNWPLEKITLIDRNILRIGV